MFYQSAYVHRSTYCVAVTIITHFFLIVKAGFVKAGPKLS
jgi:hypothetical protein